MRGDAAVTIRLLLRRVGMAGIAAAVGGLAGVATVVLPWHEVVTTVEMLGAAASRVEATAGAFPARWWAWASGLGGLTALWLGIGVAFDRPVRHARAGLIVAASALAVGGLGALLMPPEAATVLDTNAAVRGLDDRLPTGVDLELTVRASAGAWVALVAAGLVAVGAVGAREG